MKRSKTLKLAVMSLSPIALTACGDKPVDMLVYKTLDECSRDGYYSPDQCRAEFDKALYAHRIGAPMYLRLKECEADFAPNRCEYLGRFYSPRIAAYMLPLPRERQNEDNYYGGSGGSSQPLYTSRDDYGYYRTGDNSRVGKSSQSGKVTTTVSKTRAPSIKTTTVSRGGFGSQAAARGSWGGSKSFGG